MLRPLTLTSKTPPVDGINLSEPSFNLNSKIFSARPTALGS
jgi:hypothetical protein